MLGLQCRSRPASWQIYSLFGAGEISAPEKSTIALDLGQILELFARTEAHGVPFGSRHYHTFNNATTTRHHTYLLK